MYISMFTKFFLFNFLLDTSVIITVGVKIPFYNSFKETKEKE